MGARKDQGKVNSERAAIRKFENELSKAICGNSDAIQEVIKAYQDGDGVEPDSRKAFEWLKLAAVKYEYSWAFFDLAMAYKEGEGTRENAEKFLRWMTKAAEKEETEAMFQLAAFYVDDFPEIAYEWKTKMANKGGAGAALEIAKWHQRGHGIAKDAERSLEYTRKAIDSAQEALDLAAKAAIDGKPGYYTIEDLPLALFQMSLLTLGEGKDIAKDWLKKAAEAAKEAINDAQSKKVEISEELLRILARHVLSENEARVDSEHSHACESEWLQVTAEKILLKYGHNLQNCPRDLADVLYGFAKSFDESTKDRSIRRKYRKWLKLAADSGSGNALYELALLEKGEVRYELLIKAMEKENMQAYIRYHLHDFIGKKDARKTVDALMDLSKNITSIKKLHSVVIEKNGYVAHYTQSVKTIQNMLTKSGRILGNVLRLNHIAYFNDPDEGKRLIGLGDDLTNPLKFFFEDSEAGEPVQWQGYDIYVHIGSFSMVRDRLDLWRAYGNDGDGYCVVTPMTIFENSFERPLMSGGWGKKGRKAVNRDPVPSTLYRVFYEIEEAERVINNLAPVLGKLRAFCEKARDKEFANTVSKIVREIVSELLYLYKGEEYATEQEVRVVAARTPSNPGIKRKEFDFGSRIFIETNPIFFEENGSEIIIGPKVKNKAEVKIDLQHRLAENNLDQNCKVEFSKTRYR